MVTDWKEVELLSLSDGGMQNGVFYEVSRKGSGIPLINVGDMYTQVPITSEKLELFNATGDEIKRFAVNDGDLFFTRSSVVPSGIAFCNWYKKTSYRPVVFDSHVIRFKTDKSQVVPMFLYLQCISPKARKFFIANAKTATMTTIDQIIMGRCPIDIPPLPEQHRIAEVLSDIDALIATLEKLTAKKRAIKQGAMQELLTGKRRLPGFSSEWVEKKISDIGDTSSGGTPSRSIPRYFTGKTPWVTTSELNDNYIYSTAENITQEAISNSSAKLFPKGTILMAMYGATIGKLGVLAVNATTNQACCALFFNADIDSLFIYNLLLYHRADIIELGSGAGQPNISQKIVRDFTFILPPSKEEQTAIAEILSDMDAEINALTAKLNKLRNIKQGMMSELLTGRIRLTEQAAESAPQAVVVPKIIELPENDSQVAAPHAGSHSQQFDDAVMIAGIVNVLYSDKFPLGRKKVQKCLYLLRRYQDESTAAFKKKAAGPYADEVRYKGGEPIAQRHVFDGAVKVGKLALRHVNGLSNTRERVLEIH